MCRRGHKSHSHVIKAWLETQESTECLSVISISPLFSAHFVALSLLFSFHFLLPKGKKYFCHSALLQGHTFLTPLRHIYMTEILNFYSTLSVFPFFCPHFVFLPIVPLALKVAWRCPLWRHHPTVNEWVCHTANNLHSSCLICPGLHGSSHDSQAERMCLGPCRAGVKVHGSGK